MILFLHIIVHFHATAADFIRPTPSPDTTAVTPCRTVPFQHHASRLSLARSRRFAQHPRFITRTPIRTLRDLRHDRCVRGCVVWEAGGIFKILRDHCRSVTSDSRPPILRRHGPLSPAILPPPTARRRTNSSDILLPIIEPRAASDITMRPGAEAFLLLIMPM